MKKIIIVHGWEGHPNQIWFPWLKRELEKHSFEVQIPQLPEPDEPRINNWVRKLKEVAGVIDENTYFVGHSMGCQTIARFIETLPENVKIGGVVFVAGFFKRLTNLEYDDTVRSVAKEWLETHVDLSVVKKHINKSVAIFSDNDKYVPLDNKDQFEEILKSKIIIEKEKGHFSGEIKELPIVLDEVLTISR